MKRFILTFIIAAMGMFFMPPAEAFSQSTTGAMNVTAMGLPSCAASTTPMTFPDYDGSFMVNATSTVTVNCSTGVPYRIDIDAGLNTLSVNDLRRVNNGTVPATASNTIQYHLSKVNAFTTADFWGDNGATLCLGCASPPTGKNGVGIGADEVHTVYGELWPTWPIVNFSGPGAYSDTVAVTVNY